MKVNEDRYKEYAAIHAGYGLEQLQKRHEAVDGVFAQCFDQAGTDYDMGNIVHASIAGTPQEKIEALGKLHAEKASLIDAIKTKEGMSILSQQITERSDERAANGESNLGGANTRVTPFGISLAGLDLMSGDVGDRSVVQSIAAYRKDVRDGLKAMYRHVTKPAGSQQRKWRLHDDVEYGSVDLADILATTMKAGDGTGTSAGWQPEVTRSGRLVDLIMRPLQVTDIFPVISTDQAAYKYMEETYIGTNSANAPAAGVAAERAEGAAAVEAKIVLTQKTADISSIAVWIPVTEEQLDDVKGTRGYLNRKLPMLVRQRLDYQVMNGDGTAPNLAGLLNTTGIQTLAKDKDDTSIDAIRKGITKIRVAGRATVGPVLLHPSDWETIVLLKDANNNYLYGHPARESPTRIWGHRVVDQDVVAVNTAVLGDFQNHSALISRQGMTVDITDSHSDLFIKMIFAIRARVRTGVAFLRPKAFCTVTSLGPVVTE